MIDESFYSIIIMAAIVGVISRRGYYIDVCHRKQLNKSKLALYKPLLLL